MHKQRVSEIILSALRDVISELPEEDRYDVSEATSLYGSQSGLDSLGLVSLIIEVEQQINDEYNVLISLSDENALSQKSSPFRTVQTLNEYICNLLEGKNANE